MKAAPRPYWLGEATEACHACTHTYVYETVLRCAGCDRGVCAQCVVIERGTREAWCPGCHAGKRED